MKHRKHQFEPVEIRIEPNGDGNLVLWSVRCQDGTHCKGYAKSRLEGMQKAAAFVEATTIAATETARPTLVVDNGRD